MEDIQVLVDKVWCRVMELVEALEKLEAELGCAPKNET